MIAEHPDSRGRQHVIGALPVEPSQHGDPHASTTVSTIADAVPVEYRQAYLEGMLAVARENDG